MKKFIVKYLVRETGRYVDYQDYDNRDEAEKVVKSLTSQGNACLIEQEDFTGREILSQFYPAR